MEKWTERKKVIMQRMWVKYMALLDSYPNSVKWAKGRLKILDSDEISSNKNGETKIPTFNTYRTNGIR